MATDTRVRITKKMIEDSFTDLLRAYPMTKITVTQICKKAEINRVTFYKYYKDVYDLYEQIIDELLDKPSESMAKKISKKGLKEAIEIVLTDICENIDQYQVFFSNHIDSYYQIKNIEKCIAKISSLDFADYTVPAEQQDGLRTFLSFGGGGVLAAWINSGMKQPPKEIAQLLYTYITQLLKLYNKK